ncbi:unnamed protein product [Tuber aestivum]|uniref:Uncharacterized protein n=1 Tax=Tuber aestivum TaxID=59557 RepID=A0A292PVB4_9PEZI|nr:unnamed protein product [Tuber aestivum]
MRNTAGHQVAGDNVIAILPYCGEKLRSVLEQAFWSFWRISPSDWPNTTLKQRSLVFSNCSDSELEHLGY